MRANIGGQGARCPELLDLAERAPPPCPEGTGSTRNSGPLSDTPDGKAGALVMGLTDGTDPIGFYVGAEPVRLCELHRTRGLQAAAGARVRTGPLPTLLGRAQPAITPGQGGVGEHARFFWCGRTGFLDGSFVKPAQKRGES